MKSPPNPKTLGTSEDLIAGHGCLNFGRLHLRLRGGRKDFGTWGLDQRQLWVDQGLAGLPSGKLT